MDGLILVDKPAGWTSHDVVSYLRGALREKRTGHTGTLDPAATGLLLVLVGKATRLARYYEQDDKEYRAVMSLGSETDTQDAEGKVIKECPVPELTRESVESVFAKFTGEISQTPPMYSAVKRNGRPLYAHARAGVEVEVSPRKVFIRGIGFVEMEGPLVTFDTRCSKGTYIRTLCKDMGEALGSCAHLLTLRRVSVGGYKVEDAVSIEGKPSGDDIIKYLTPLDKILPGLPSAVVNGPAARRVRDGRAPAREEAVMPDALPAGAPLRVFDEDGNLLAMAESTGEHDMPLLLKVVLV